MLLQAKPISPSLAAVSSSLRTGISHWAIISTGKSKEGNNETWAWPPAPPPLTTKPGGQKAVDAQANL